MKFGSTIVYAPDVAASLAYFERAFGFTGRKYLRQRWLARMAVTQVAPSKKFRAQLH
jgi:hypothetical protein